MSADAEPAQANPLEGRGAPEKQLFMGKKERRRSSSAKGLFGDGLKLESNEEVMKVLTAAGDRKVLFSDEVMKVNKRLKTQKRVLAVTDQAVCSITPSSLIVKRRIPFQELGAINLSCLTDNFFALRVPSEYDYLMVSARKTEIVVVVTEAYKKAIGRPLPVNFANTFEYRIDEKKTREIRFVEVEGGVSTQIFTKQ
ncbi:putative myosin heavy chain [Monocercomonoides exilis]|uniref:putative myosin heavy chain n=1 Tax=Monocercomonoides exilis TaxID=2049356 RepID=UPI00355A10CA|nr:putative myosin heavy chain [Monocercomonoides exilis]